MTTESKSRSKRTTTRGALPQNEAPRTAVEALSKNTAAHALLIDELGLKDEEQDQRLDEIESRLGWTPIHRSSTTEPRTDPAQPKQN
jgi:hypothetical protein